ncbi:UNVERIFIED_CONTAM: hypothetical protein K2H54_063465 [Gekko kuhli]
MNEIRVRQVGDLAPDTPMHPLAPSFETGEYGMLEIAVTAESFEREKIVTGAGKNEQTSQTVPLIDPHQERKEKSKGQD